MRVHSTAAIIALLVLAACSAAPAASEAESSTPEPTATEEPTGPAEPTEEATEEPTATPSASSEVCTMGDMPDLDSWTFLQGLGGGFGIAYPDDWEDLSGETEFTASTLLDEEIFEQLGQPDDATILADFVRAPEGVPNFSVFVFGPVDFDAEEIADIEVARYEALDEIERIVDPSIEACVGGEPATAVALEFESSDGETYYQQNVFAIRDGELIVVQWLDFAEDPDLELFEDILSTWGWMGFSDSGSGDGIAEAHMVDEIDQSSDEPDPSTYVSSYTADAPAIYVAFRVDPGAEGRVEVTWSIDGEVASEAAIDVAAGTTWAWAGITPLPGGFNPGDYEARLELNGDVERVEFTVDPP